MWSKVLELAVLLATFIFQWWQKRQSAAVEVARRARVLQHKKVVEAEAVIREKDSGKVSRRAVAQAHLARSLMRARRLRRAQPAK